MDRYAHRDGSRECRPVRPTIEDAAEALYRAGRWSCGLPPAEEARLWENLRDALGFAPGTATKAGVAAATNLCPYCADKPDCECEPPLPFLDRPGAEL
jgi:hypothetical protein